MQQLILQSLRFDGFRIRLCTLKLLPSIPYPTLNIYRYVKRLDGLPSHPDVKTIAGTKHGLPRDQTQTLPKGLSSISWQTKGMLSNCFALSNMLGQGVAMGWVMILKLGGLRVELRILFHDFVPCLLRRCDGAFKILDLLLISAS